MYLYIYMYMYIYLFVYIYVYVYVYIYTYTHTDGKNLLQEFKCAPQDSLGSPLPANETRAIVRFCSLNPKP